MARELSQLGGQEGLLREVLDLFTSIIQEATQYAQQRGQGLQGMAYPQGQRGGTGLNFA